MTTEHIGRMISGRYRLISRLAEGGMGVTYRAWDGIQALPVVVKMPKREAHSQQDALRRFAREIDAMLALPHERIVPITDHGEENGCPYVVMRFLPGGSLADHRRRDKAGKPLANAAGMLHFWLPAVAEALDSIHQKGVLHRDVKPGNIFFDGFWNAFLGDFGIAKVVDSSAGIAKEETLTATMMAIGTPEYMAPELFSPSGKPDGRADQYALAVTVYEMLAGVRPFTGERAHIVVEQCGMPVPPLPARQLRIPPSLCVAVERALAKTPEERFSTCLEFARAALLEVDTLPAEPGTARLMCPSCKKILKMPASAGGQWGRCPKCKVAVRVAPGLTALWLTDEEIGVRSDRRSIVNGVDAEALPEIRSERARQMWPSLPTIAWLSAASVFTLALLIAGFLLMAFPSAERPGQQQESVVETTASPVLSGTDSQSLATNNAKADAERLQLAAENERLKAELALVGRSKGRRVAPGSPDGKNSSAHPREDVGKAESAGPRSHTVEEVNRSAPQVIWDYGDVVTFTGSSLDTQVAQDLASRSGSLRLRPVSNQLSLSPQAAASLARHKGRTILFAGTTALSRDAAQAIAIYPNTLAFEHLAPLTQEVATALAARAGGLYVGGCDQAAFESAIAKLQESKGRVIVPSRTAAAIGKASKYLLSQQREDGSWEAMRSADKRAGATALVMLALANTGVTAEQPAMRRALTWLRQQKPDDTYSVALQTMILAMLAPDSCRATLERNVEWLERAQVKQGPGAGCWTYGQSNDAGMGDNSNAQFAVLALHEAHRVGVRTRGDAWVRAQKYWKSCANDDGSWGYTLGKTDGSGSMTCAGVVSLWLASSRLGIADARESNGIIACCRGASPPEGPAGVRWLGSKFTVSENPGTGGESWLYYYLAGLSRVRRFTGQRFFDDGSSAQLYDSARLSSETLLGNQDRQSGKFSANRIEDAIVATSMALLVLADCSKPALIAKSVHEPAAGCDCHSRDVDCLVDAINQRLSGVGKPSYSWHRLPLAAATESQLAEAPLLVISGRQSFDLGDNAAARLRRFTDSGGVVFAEPSCGESSKFDQCLRALVSKMFPEEELVLRVLSKIPDDHRLWGSGTNVVPDDRPRLLGVEYGGRLRVIYNPLQDPRQPSLSCLWELSQSTGSLSVASRLKVAAAVEFGESLAMYAASARSRPDAYALANIRTQGKLQRCVRPASRAESTTSGSAVGTAFGHVESLSQAWSAYETQCGLELARIEGQIKTRIAEQGSHLRLELLLELENAVEMIRRASLLPDVSAADVYDLDAAIKVARVNEVAASRALWHAYNTAIQEASQQGESGNGAVSLVRERDQVFDGLGFSPSESDVFGIPGEEGSSERSSAGGEAEPAIGVDAAAAETVELPSLTNSIGMKFRLILAGSFTMGDTKPDRGPHGEFKRPAGSLVNPDEMPQTVTITTPFYISVYEVTNAEWKRVMKSRPSKWREDDRPVDRLDGYKADEFCRQLTAMPEERAAGRIYRLPTEAEWEYACRAGTTTTYSFGDEESLLGDYCWFRGNCEQTQPVGQKKPNAWGLYDMHGNVWEICRNFPDDKVMKPRFIEYSERGGSWIMSPKFCRSAYYAGFSGEGKGVRLAMSLSGDEPMEAAGSFQPGSVGTSGTPVTRDVPSATEQAELRSLTNSLGIEFKLVPAGSFTMGDADGGPDEKPHEVTLTKPFYMGVYEVTNAQWKRVMGDYPYRGDKKDDHPAQEVDWDMAVGFCEKLSALPEEKNAGRVYRLPTEAEWEYTCRAGTTTAYSFGDGEGLLWDYGWFRENRNLEGAKPVGQKNRNPWGFYDMHGNVWEWCVDRNGDYPDSAAVNPRGPPSGLYRVIRGGSYWYSARVCRSAFRYWVEPSSRTRPTGLGFRLAMSEPGDAARDSEK